MIKLKFETKTDLGFTAVIVNWVRLCPSGDIRQCVETSGVVTTGRNVLMASIGQRNGMLLNILQCTGQPPAAKNEPVQDVNTG